MTINWTAEIASSGAPIDGSCEKLFWKRRWWQTDLWFQVIEVVGGVKKPSYSCPTLLAIIWIYTSESTDENSNVLGGTNADIDFYPITSRSCTKRLNLQVPR